MTRAYYNEFDKNAAAWLRELINAGHIADGDVDERSVEDVFPSDLIGYTQCHFFAGIGVWSYALRQAGWSDDRPIWTGSCPCQPFSAAGKGTAFADERHLWPAFHHLIKERKPSAVIGEQVASKDADPWLDLVQDDLEAMDYAFGALAFPSAGVGAPHIRDRTYWGVVANMHGSGLDTGSERQPPMGYGASAESNSRAIGMEQSMHLGRQRGKEAAPRYEHDGEASERTKSEHGACFTSAHRIHQNGAGPTNGFWRDADWLGCRDGKFRPVEPGTFPLAHGAPARVVRLRGYGNAINAIAAQTFIEAFMEIAA